MTTVLLLVAVALALATVYLWIRDPHGADIPQRWPLLTAQHSPLGAGREFGTLALTDALERARADPALAQQLAGQLHRRLGAVVDARLAAITAMGARINDDDVDALVQFRQQRPDPATLTEPRELDQLLTRIEGL